MREQEGLPHNGQAMALIEFSLRAASDSVDLRFSLIACCTALRVAGGRPQPTKRQQVAATTCTGTTVSS